MIKLSRLQGIRDGCIGGGMDKFVWLTKSVRVCVLPSLHFLGYRNTRRLTGFLSSRRSKTFIAQTLCRTQAGTGKLVTYRIDYTYQIS
ncbi:unnamed protein product [Toxocara canis]|uniref:Uncharacterized protein n=1 Tax=Toxocara canis TaxID=6265 RepID=A0A183UTH5_TOXCA|nr:unnamed protein product [Toxocara canis]